ncbi:MAG: polyisoprenoid-binding protein YceI [Myxococcota bacterium]
MSVIDANQGECQVFTFKEGLLSPMAHDIKLQLDRWSLTHDPEARTLSGTFDPASVRVVCARKNGADSPGTLSSGDMRKIQKTIQNDVLKTRRFGEIRFAGHYVATDGEPAGSGFTVEGELTLAGRTCPITAVVTLAGDQLVATARIHQPDFGIKPYSAMFGALKVQAAVEVRVAVPAAVGRTQ